MKDSYFFLQKVRVCGGVNVNIFSWKNLVQVKKIGFVCRATHLMKPEPNVL